MLLQMLRRSAINEIIDDKGIPVVVGQMKYLDNIAKQIALLSNESLDECLPSNRFDRCKLFWP